MPMVSGQQTTVSFKDEKTIGKKKFTSNLNFKMATAEGLGEGRGVGRS